LDIINIATAKINSIFLAVVLVAGTIAAISPIIAHPINAFHAPLHGDITDESLGFLQSDVLDKISRTNVDVDETDDETNKGSEFHFYSCDFQGTTENINTLYDQLVTNIKDIDAPETFGMLLHPVQDFYTHSNWVELGKNDLINNGDGKWIVLKPFQEYKDVSIVQVEDKNDIPEGYTLSENEKVVDVSSQSGNHPGLISSTLRDKDFCPEDVALDHDILHKDDSDRPGYDKARALAKAQTIHEWCRLTNLVEQSHGQDGVQLLFNSWVDDIEKANSVCHSDGSSLNTDVEDNSYVEEQDKNSEMQMTNPSTQQEDIQQENKESSIMTQEKMIVQQFEDFKELLSSMQDK
jgi:hypothetical protein